MGKNSKKNNKILNSKRITEDDFYRFMIINFMADALILLKRNVKVGVPYIRAFYIGFLKLGVTKKEVDRLAKNKNLHQNNIFGLRQ